jgi:MFS family permease
MLGGFVAAALLHWFDWRAVFLFGAGVGLTLLPLVLWALPEPLAFLLARRNARTLDNINKLLARCGHDAITALPPADPKTSTPYLAVFSAAQRAATLRVTTINLLFIVTVYYFLSWLPQLIVDAGFSASIATSVSATASLAGVVAAVGFGVLAGFTGLRPLLAATMVGLGIAIAAFGYTPSSLVLLTSVAAVAGIFQFSGIVGLYTMIADAFPPEMRATGTGFVMGIGRICGALSPAIAGALFAVGGGRGEVSLIMGAGAIIAGAIVALPAAQRKDADKMIRTQA